MGSGYHVVEAKIVSGSDIHSYNTFDDAEQVCECDFTGIRTENGLQIHLPAASVVELRLAK